MKSRCDTGRIATMSIPDGRIRVPADAAAPPVPDRSNAVRRDHAATRRGGDPEAGGALSTAASNTCAATCRAPASALAPALLARRVRAAAARFVSTGRHPGSAGADRGGAAASPDQLDGDHARRRGSGDPGHVGVRLVVPVIQHPRQPRHGRAYEGRIEFVVWSIPALIVILLGGVIWIGSHQLDPRAPIPGECRPAAGRRRGARLEMAVHLSRSGRRRRQSAGHPGRNPGRISAHLGDGDEFVLRAAAGQPDLHDGRHDHAPQPACGQAGRVSRLFGKFQRRRLFRDAVRRQGGAGRPISTPGSSRCAAPDRRSTRPATPSWQSRARPCRRRPIARSSRSCSSASSTRRWRVPKGAAPARPGLRRLQPGGRLTCWAG